MSKPLTQKQQQVLNAFKNYTPCTEQSVRFQNFLVEARDLAHHILDETAPSREQSLALTKLEEVVLWVRAAIERE